MLGANEKPPKPAVEQAKKTAAELAFAKLVALDEELENEIQENRALLNRLSLPGQKNIVNGLIEEIDAIREEQLRNAEEFVRQYPESAEGHNFLGLIYYDSARPGDALDEWKKAVALRPDFAEAHNNLGTYYSHFGEPLRAVECFERAAKIGPPKPVYYFNLSVLFFTARNEVAKQRKWTLPRVFEECQKMLLKANALEPKYQYLRDYAMNYYAAPFFGVGDQTDKAIQAWEKCRPLAKTKDQQIEIETHLGRLYFKKKDKARAIEHLKKAIELGAELPATHLLKRAQKEL